MSRSPDIIEAVPQSVQKEYNKTMKKLWITAGGMAITTGLFFAGITSPYAGCLGALWFYSELAGSGYALWNLKRRAKLIETMAGLSIKTTYTVGEVVTDGLGREKEQTPSKGRNRILRLMPPGLRGGISLSDLFK